MWVSYAIAAAILVAAALVIFRSVRAFFSTGGRSACDGCPYSGSCAGRCEKSRKK
jgi:radical SAM protein with 4Fe4S-binding SPASM domain